MDEQQARTRANQAQGSVGRRGVLAGVAAVVAGALAKASERVAQAAGNGAALTMGNNDSTTNNPTNQTTLVRAPGGSGFYALEVVDNNSNPLAMHAKAGTYEAFLASPAGVFSVGVQGYTGTGQGPGVQGLSGVAVINNLPMHCGVAGFAQNNSDGVGVYGEGRAYGLQGMASTFQGSTGNGVGVLGQSNSGVGVQGSSNGNVGVLGTSNASVGVYANSISQTGLYATSGSGTGIVASTNNGNAIQGASNGDVGVLGTSNSSIGGFFSSGTSTGLYATGPGSAFAARFDGPVQVNGSFTVLGGPKSAAVPHPDGSHRRLYCMESPESWFEDFGRDQLVNGRARVRLDPDFAAIVQGNQYHVFLTSEGDSNGLYVADRNANGFEIREKKGGTSSHAFSYRVVAKRKDIAGPRLEKVDVQAPPQRPAAPQPPPTIPALPPLPDPNAPPRVAPVGGDGRAR
ncbi:MAG TPA: hypothetical protein VK066_16960 [Chloroflexota bacterium]|nr:hypothetical protein [Chloroflexota bacterium]